MRSWSGAPCRIVATAAARPGGAVWKSSSTSTTDWSSWPKPLSSRFRNAVEARRGGTIRASAESAGTILASAAESCAQNAGSPPCGRNVTQASGPGAWRAAAHDESSTVLPVPACAHTRVSTPPPTPRSSASRRRGRATSGTGSRGTTRSVTTTTSRFDGGAARSAPSAEGGGGTGVLLSGRSNVSAVERRHDRGTAHPVGVKRRHPHPSELGVVDESSYEIRIRGRVSDTTLASFDGLDAEIEPAETVLRGTVADQAALHGILERVRELGLELLELRRVPGQPPLVEPR